MPRWLMRSQRVSWRRRLELCLAAELRSPDARAEVLTIALRDLVAGEAMILPAALGDFDGTEQRSKPPCRRPVVASVDTVKQSRAERVAAPGGVQYRLRFDARNR